MARSLAEDRDLNVASPIIESQVRPPSTESILDDPAYSQNAGNWYCGPKLKGRFCATGASCAFPVHGGMGVVSFPDHFSPHGKNCVAKNGLGTRLGWEAVGFFLPRARIREAGLSNWFCPSVCLSSVCPVKKIETSRFTGLNDS